MADKSLFEFLHMEMVAYVYKHQSGDNNDQERGSALSTLEGLGFRVGQGLIERFTKDAPSFKDDLDAVKFLCKDLWINLFRKQIDNLRTNHQGTYVLQDNKFSLLSQFSNSKQYIEEAPKQTVELRADTCRAGLCPPEVFSSLTSALEFLGVEEEAGSVVGSEDAR
ncbi:UNVERIFIED_CONTAM: hypothetical protein FKN15_072227 [Acipenser sinensis]